MYTGTHTIVLMLGNKYLSVIGYKTEVLISRNANLNSLLPSINFS